MSATTRPEAIRFCECPEGAYHGAQLVGTAPLCERCKRLPNEPWVHQALLAALDGTEALRAREKRIREQTDGNVRWNTANIVAYAIAEGTLDGTDPGRVAAAINARTPEEFKEACIR